VYEYVQCDTTNDYGVDASGVAPHGRRCVIQIKYRANKTHLIEYNELARTFTQGVLEYQMGVGNDGNSFDNTLYVFTNANGVNIQAEHVLSKELVVIDGDIISGMVDNNLPFWYGCCEILNKYIS
jgi:hypothetical protein